MSRRARLEEENQRLFNQELEAEENRIKAQKDRIYAPIIWKRLTSGIKIQDLKPNYYDKVLEIIEDIYFSEEVLSRNTKISEDPLSVKSFLKSVIYNLKDNTSLIAVDEMNKDCIAGFLILKVIHKAEMENVFERTIQVEGEALKKCTAFVNFLGRKADVFGILNCEVYLKFSLLCVTPEYRKKGLGLQLMLSALDVARSLNISVIMGIFSSWSLQKLANNIGMQVIHEAYYVDWCDRFNERIFGDPGVGNYTCAIMAGKISFLSRSEPKLTVVEKTTISQLTREEKRRNKTKE